MLEGREVHAATGVGGNGDEGQAEDARDAAVSVVGLVGGGDCFARHELASHPKGFEVREGAAAGEMAEVLRPLKHLCEGRYGFDLHGGAGATAVESVIVRVDRHGKRISGASDGVRWLQHLASVEGVGVGEVVVQAFGDLM